MWKTGGPAYDPIVKRALGLEVRDQIIGFVYLGTATMAGQVKSPNMDGRIQFL